MVKKSDWVNTKLYQNFPTKKEIFNRLGQIYVHERRSRFQNSFFQWIKRMKAFFFPEMNDELKLFVFHEANDELNIIHFK